MQCTDVIHRQPKLYCQIMGRETRQLGSNVLMLSIYDADVKKTHKKSMYRANPKGTESHQTFRGWVRFQNHRTRTEQINRVLRSIQTGRERRWSSSGVTERFTYWHLVLTKLVSTLSLACPLINKTEMQVQLWKVNVDSFVHVWGNKSVNYTSMDINVFFHWSRGTQTDIGNESVSQWIMHRSCPILPSIHPWCSHPLCGEASLSTVN